MKLTIPKEPEKAKTFDLCEREDISIKQVVKQRAEILKIMENKNWVPHVVEKLNLRLKYLDGRIVEEYLKNGP